MDFLAFDIQTCSTSLFRKPVLEPLSVPHGSSGRRQNLGKPRRSFRLGSMQKCWARGLTWSFRLYSFASPGRKKCFRHGTF